MDETFLKDLLECSVCLEKLDSSSKMLPCQHTFCKRCLYEILNLHKELRCHLCQRLVDAKIEELPCNIWLVRLLESKKNSIQPKKVNSSADSSSSSSEQPTSSHPQLHRRIGNLGQPNDADFRMDPKQLVEALLEEALLEESETNTRGIENPSPAPQPRRSKRRRLDHHSDKDFELVETLLEEARVMKALLKECEAETPRISKSTLTSKSELDHIDRHCQIFGNLVAESVWQFFDDETTSGRVKVTIYNALLNAEMLSRASSRSYSAEQWHKLSSLIREKL